MSLRSFQHGILQTVHSAPPSFSDTKSLSLGSTKNMTAASALPNTFGNGSWSISFWFKVSGQGQFFSTLNNASGTTNAQNQGFSLFITASGQPGLYNRNTANNVNAYGYTTASFADGAWHHVAFVWDNTQSTPFGCISIYIDGTSRAITNGGSSPTVGDYSSTQPPAFNETGFPFSSGNIDEFSTWQVALSSANVTSLYNSGSPTDLSTHAQYANLVNWWRMGDLDDSASTIKDRKGSNNLTLTNFVSGDIVTDVP